MEVVAAVFILFGDAVAASASFPRRCFFLAVPPLLASHTPIPRDPISSSDSGKHGGAQPLLMKNCSACLRCCRSVVSHALLKIFEGRRRVLLL